MDDDGFDAKSKAAFLGSSSSARTMADGSLRITVDLSPMDAIGAFTAFGSPGSPVAIARIANKVAVEAERPKADKPVHGGYGEYARSLKLSGFFRTPAVWEAIGPDKDYLEWVKRQKSAISGEFSEYHDDGEAYCIPAHYRRVAHGSGTGIKPPYSAIPLTDREHKEAHQLGDTNLRPEEWWEQMRIKYVSDWAWQSLKEQLFYESWSEVPPNALHAWARKHNVVKYLPLTYREYGGGETAVHEEADDS